jgi:hypothetical protein
MITATTISLTPPAADGSCATRQFIRQGGQGRGNGGQNGQGGSGQSGTGPTTQGEGIPSANSEGSLGV